MINLIIIIIPYLGINIHFWLLLFLAAAICRYRYNGNKPLFISSLIVTTIVIIAPLFSFGIYVFQVMAYPQIFVGGWSIWYNLSNRIWKKDVVFLVMEPVLILFLLRYVIFGGFDPSITTKLFNWLEVYIALQSLAIITKTVIAYRLTRDEKVNRFYLLRRLLIRIDSSLGLNDLASIGIGGITAPTPDEMMKEKVDLYGKEILSTIKYELSVDKNLKVDKQKSDSDSDKKRENGASYKKQ